MRSTCRTGLAGLAAALCLLIPATAHALPDVRADLDLPATFAANASGQSGTLRLTAINETPPAPLLSGPNNFIGFCNSAGDSEGCSDTALGSPWNRGILLTPTCAQTAAPSVGANTCAAPDPGVLVLAATATGSGPACAGTVFDVTPFDPVRGTYRFTPRPGGSRLYLGASGSYCEIAFAFSATKAPADADPATPGLQTRSIASAGAEWNQPTVQIPHYKPEPIRAIDGDITTVSPAVEYCDPPANTQPKPPSGVCPTPPPPVEYCDPPANTQPKPPSGVCPQPPPPVEYCDPPANTQPKPPSGVCPVPPEFCDPPLNTIPKPPSGICLGGSGLADARLAGAPSCSTGKSAVARAADKPFTVSVTVQSSDGVDNFSRFVSRVEFLRNGKVFRTMRTPTRKVTNLYSTTVDPTGLAPRRKYTGKGKNRKVAHSRLYRVTARVVLKAPAATAAKRYSFAGDGPALTKRLTGTGASGGGKSLAFRAVSACQAPTPPDPPG